MEDAPYSRAELLAAGSKLPERGPLCEHCKIHIPQFADLSEADERRIRSLRLDRPITAMAELRSATGCSILWAKLWVQHGGRPCPSGEEIPCPYCGKQLRTSLSKQCRFCLRDWHDPEHLRILG